MTKHHTAIATVMADYGKRTLINLNGTIQSAMLRHTHLRCAVGDTVDIAIDPTSNSLWVSKIHSRRNALYRADLTKQKCFAANVDKVCLMLAPEPAPLFDLLARTVVACHAANLPLHIILNKTDLPTFEQLIPVIDILTATPIEYTALNTQSDTAVNELRPILYNQRCLILGQSGVGKSSLINQLIPNANAQTQALSQSSLTGKHTTTSSYLYQYGTNCAKHSEYFEIIDSPGFQNFGLQHIPSHQWIEAFTTLTPYITDCRFYNCTHRHEPNCAVIQSINQMTNQFWYTLFQNLHSREI